MTDVITVVDSTLATQAQSTQVVQAGYIAQTVSSSGGTLASTVTDETTYGLPKAVGTSAASAREDHTHGSPSLGTTSTTAAAGTHAHAGVYDPAGTAAGLVNSEAATRANADALLLAKASNLSDLANAGTARTNLGTPPSTRLVSAGTGLSGGGDLTVDRTLAVAYGITGTTAAAGNDARLSDARTPTAHAASHASGGSDPVTPAAIGADAAGAATSAVSTHVAAADPHGDRAYAVQRANHTGTQLAATISDFAATVGATAVLKATATTKGDLIAATGNATIARLGAGADGQVLVADSSQAAGLKYSDLRPYVRSVRITSGDINLPNTASAWAVLLDTTTAIVGVTIPAVVGEWVQVHVHGMRSQTAARYIDVAVVTGAGPTIQRYLSSGTSTPSTEGDPGWYPAAAFQLSNGPRGFTVASGDLDAGNVRFAVVVKTAGATGTLYASALYPLYLQAENKRVVL